MGNLAPGCNKARTRPKAARSALMVRSKEAVNGTCYDVMRRKSNIGSPACEGLRIGPLVSQGLTIAFLADTKNE